MLISIVLQLLASGRAMGKEHPSLDPPTRDGGKMKDGR